MSEGRKFLVQGRVQGVWFRESTRQQAERLAVTGHAINLPDGSVEVVAHGETAALDKLERWLHQGPRLARVTAVQSTPVSGDGPERFSTG